jgi:hypothetical protein
VNDSMQCKGVICGVALLLAAACGSSAKSSSASANHKDGGSASGASSGDEGTPCDSTHKCANKLTCVESLFVNVSICARGCTTKADCANADEVCYTYSGMPKDGHCVNLVTDEYATCGVADTSVCDHRSCLYLPDEPIGVCIDTCALDGTTSGTSDEDAGVAASTAAPQGAVACAAAETCIDGTRILTSADPNEGVCGIVAKRGESCGIEHGIYCDVADICAPKDPNDLSSAQLCFQDCSAAGTRCDTGKCIDVQGFFSYCM